nr:primosomal protein N' [bacterium]
MAQIAAVAVDILAGEVDRTFDYRIPAEMQVFCGQAVRVPFGPGRKDGIVIRVKDHAEVEEDRLKDILSAGKSVLSDEQIDLALDMREKYHATLAACLRLMVPPQVRAGQQLRGVKMVELTGQPVTLRRGALAMQGVLDALAAGPMALTELTRQVSGGAAGAVRALAQKGAVRVWEEGIDHTPYKQLENQGGQVRHTVQQQRAIEAIERAQAGGGGAFLLRGATGSGKTEVYLTAMERALARGKGGIILVPEIALTPQMVSRFRARFGDALAVLHSRLSQAERLQQWQRIKSRQARVVIGARSAIFAPVDDIGLIVVDEEHEHSYVSERTPCYDAVEIALWRARRAGAAAVLGSATPSLERYARAIRGELTLLSMPERIGTGGMPQVSIVDLRQELAQGNRSIFSRELIGRMQRCLERGEQMMLFVNRRGHSTFVSCRACGQAIECPNCDVAETYHLGEQKLKCHYCGHIADLPQVCPACGSRSIRHFGAGTERVEQEVAKLFPGTGVLRMDRDTTVGRDAYLDILERFRRREAQVLIGTQMIAKGLDFPMVTLVGVVAADVTLHLPDFRAQEKTFQLIMQVAGRAGRAERPGHVIVQTYSPEEPAIVCAAAHDYLGFFEGEIKRRADSQYPPFGRYVRIVFSGEDEAKVRQAAGQAYEAWRQTSAGQQQWQQALLFDGCMEAPIRRLKQKFRYQVLARMVECPAADQMEGELYRLALACKIRGVLANLEVNPQNMM